MTLELLGVITDIFPIETYPNFKKRRFWLQQPGNEKFPQHWQVEVHTNQLHLLDPVKAGDKVVCTINLLGRQLKNKVGEKVIINSLQCWKLRKEEEDYKKPTGKPVVATVGNDDDTDLPF